MDVGKWWDMLRHLGVITGWLQPESRYEVVSRQAFRATQLKPEGKTDAARRFVEDTLAYCAIHYEELAADDKMFQVTYFPFGEYFELLGAAETVAAAHYEILVRIGEHFVEHRDSYEADVRDLSREEFTGYFRDIFG